MCDESMSIWQPLVGANVSNLKRRECNLGDEESPSVALTRVRDEDTKVSTLLQALRTHKFEKLPRGQKIA